MKVNFVFKNSKCKKCECKRVYQTLNGMTCMTSSSLMYRCFDANSKDVSEIPIWRKKDRIKETMTSNQ